MNNKKYYYVDINDTSSFKKGERQREREKQWLIVESMKNISELLIAL